MKIAKMILGALVISCILLGACKKYEAGPEISLIPRKDRVANTWEIEHAVEDDSIITGDFRKYELYLTKEGQAQLTYDYTLDGITYQGLANGTWEFTSDEENINFNFEDDSQDGEYKILKLLSKQMWLRKLGTDVDIYLRQK